jgi:hypothetical protein
MLPTNEIDTLTMTVTDAIDLAAEGKVADGYACLVWGLHRAEGMVEEGKSVKAQAASPGPSPFLSLEAGWLTGSRS